MSSDLLEGIESEVKVQTYKIEEIRSWKRVSFPGPSFTHKFVEPKSVMPTDMQSLSSNLTRPKGEWRYA